MNDSVTFIVATHRDDRPLARCLHSIAYQMGPNDEVIVVGDTLESELAETQKIVSSFGSSFRYLPYNAGHHCWGHCQHNYAITQAQGEYIHLNDDDDVWTQNARHDIARAMKTWPGQLFLFRFKSYFGTIFWENPGLMARNHIGGHCMVVPNDQDKIGKFTCEYSGDFDWIRDTHLNYSERAIWIDAILAQARPG